MASVTQSSADGIPVAVSSRASMILCPLCGTRIQSNPSNLCADCLRTQVDLSSEVQTTGTLTQCKRCEKWLTKSKQWVPAEWESRELLAVVLKYVHGLGSKVRVVDAGFIWREPHSRRVAVRVTMQKEVMNGVQVQQRVEAEFVVKTFQCDDCTRSQSDHTWKALVQIRQRVEHKRTFYFLEQVILAKHMQEQLIDLQLAREGMDLYFADKRHAEAFVSFVSTVVPTRTKASRKLISEDRQSNSHNNQHTTVVEIVPLCKDDLVLLPRSAGVIQGFCLVSRVTSVVHLTDPTTLGHIEIPATKYWRAPVEAVMTSKDLVQFEVLDVEPVKGPGHADSSSDGCAGGERPGAQRGFCLAEVEVAKSSDFGVNDTTYRVMSHLGHVLRVGDSVMGYDIKNATSLGGHEDEVTSLKYEPQDVILVKKVHLGGKRSEKRRLRRLAQRSKTADATGQPKKSGKERAGSVGTVGEDDKEFEAFARDLEESEEMLRLLEMEAAAGGGSRPEQEESIGAQGEEEQT